MYAWKVTEAQILQAAELTGLRVPGISRVGKTERSALSFVLRLDTSKRRDDGSLPYQRVSMNRYNDTGDHRC